MPDDTTKVIERHWVKEVGPLLLDQGYVPLPAPYGQKKVVLHGWSEMTRDRAREQMPQWSERMSASNLSILMGVDGLFGLDVDVLDRGISREILAWTRREWGEAPIRIGATPKHTTYYRIESGGSIAKCVLGRWRDSGGVEHGVEILGRGSQSVGWGLHSGVNRDYTWPSGRTLANTALHELPQVTLEQVQELSKWIDEQCDRWGWERVGGRAAGAAAADTEDTWDGGGDSPCGLSADEIREVLDCVDLDGAHYDDWLRTMMAVWHETDGSEEGLELFLEASRRSGKHDEAYTVEKWNRGGLGGGGGGGGRAVTMRTLLWETRDARADAAVDAAVEGRDRWMAEIAAAGSSGELEKKIGPKIKADKGLGDTDREALVTAIQGRIKELDGGGNFSRPKIREWLTPARDVVRGGDGDGPVVAGWVQEWWWLRNQSAYYHPGRRVLATIASVNVELSRLVPPGSQYTDAHSYMMYEAGVRVAHDRCYLPGGEATFELDGQLMINTWSPGDGAAVLAEMLWTEKQAEAVRRVREHLEWLFPDERERTLLINWLAWRLRHPGKKMTWAVVIQGVEGCGKNMLMLLLMAVYGARHIGYANGGELGSGYTGWAEGSIYQVLDELQTRGKNRWDVSDVLKPYITNRRITINEKFEKRREVLNTQDLLILCNLLQSLAISQTDRRHLILCCAAQTAADLAGLPDDYFEKLVAAIEGHGDALAGWLLSVPEHPDFKPFGHAPETQWLAEAKEGSLADIDCEILSVLEDVENPFLNGEVVSVTVLTQVLHHRGERVNERKIGLRMKSLGYESLGRHRLLGTRHKLRSKNAKKFAGWTGADFAKFFEMQKDS